MSYNFSILVELGGGVKFYGRIIIREDGLCVWVTDIASYVFARFFETINLLEIVSRFPGVSKTKLVLKGIKTLCIKRVKCPAFNAHISPITFIWVISA